MTYFLIATMAWMAIKVFGRLYAIGYKQAEGKTIGATVVELFVSLSVFLWAFYLLKEIL